MTAVCKYPLSGHVNELKMPEGAKVLCVQMQRGAVCLWAEVDPKAPLTPRTFVTIGTGVTFAKEPDDVYIGTVQTHNGVLVWHVYETEN